MASACSRAGVPASLQAGRQVPFQRLQLRLQCLRLLLRHAHAILCSSHAGWL